MSSTERSHPTSHDHLIAGLVGGLLSTVAFFPVELIKTRMQVQESGQGTYRNFYSSFRHVIRREGFKGLYQGLSPAVIASCGSWGGYFYLYEMAKKRKHERGGPDAKLNSFDHLLAGFEAGIILALLFNPLWVAKTRLALQGASRTGRPYSGLSDALLTISREEGLRGLYKGVIPALILTSHGAIQFAAYEWLKKFAVRIRATPSNSTNPSGNNEQPVWVSMLIGATAKILASTITYPYQVIRSRLQQRGGPHYEGTIDCAVKIWRNEGLGGFFRGVIPNAMKVAPQAALTFVAYEETIKFLTHSRRVESSIVDGALTELESSD